MARPEDQLLQAAEKLAKAVRVRRGLIASKEHRIAVLVQGVSSGEPRPLPSDDPWAAKRLALDPLSAYGTAFRYPTLTGKRKPGPESAAVTAWIAKIRALIDAAKIDLLA